MTSFAQATPGSDYVASQIGSTHRCLRQASRSPVLSYKELSYGGYAVRFQRHLYVRVYGVCDLWGANRADLKLKSSLSSATLISSLDLAPRKSVAPCFLCLCGATCPPNCSFWLGTCPSSCSGFGSCPCSALWLFLALLFSASPSILIGSFPLPSLLVLLHSFQRCTYI